MGLLSIFKRQTESPRGVAPSAGDASDAVQRARTRARRRLVGAAVLLGIGIIGFPIVFETQPRPIPVNIPIETPPRDGAPALTMPAARPSTGAAAASVASTKPAAPAEVITESREDMGREVAASAPLIAPTPTPTPAPAPVAVAPKPAAAASKPSAERKPATDGARAQALLEGKPAKVEKTEKGDKAAESGRFVVQVGAFADAAAARETRLKAEKLGLKTYTQVASTPSGNRIRVRLGPFTSRGDADKALAKARDAGLTAVVLTL